MKTIASINVGQIRGVLCHKIDPENFPLFGVALNGGDFGYGEHICIGTRPHAEILRKTPWQRFRQEIGQAIVEIREVPEYGMVLPDPDTDCQFSRAYIKLQQLLVTAVFRELHIGMHAGLRNHFIWYMKCGSPDVLIRQCAAVGVPIEVDGAEEKWWLLLSEYSFS